MHAIAPIHIDNVLGRDHALNSANYNYKGSILCIYTYSGNAQPETIGHTQTCLQPESGASRSDCAASSTGK